ncbi:MAG: hypothetical protein II896_06105 [Clostridia bacterium]|nr:hypothetical protein [Clostridia bacterium]
MSQINRLEEVQARLAEATKDIRAYVDGLVDESSFVEMNAQAEGVSRLDGAPIAGEGVLVGTATLFGYPVVVVAQNAGALYGSFGRATADKICRAFDLAQKRGIAVVSVLDSKGARVGEGVDMLEGYGAVLKRASQFYEANGLHVCIVKGQATGLMATFAAIADFRLMEEGGALSILAPQVVAAKTGKPHEAVTSALANAQKGTVDFVCENGEETSAVLHDLWDWFVGVYRSEDDPNREAPALSEGYTVDALLDALADDGDYLEWRKETGKAARCVLAHVNGVAVGVVACDYAESPVLDAKAAKKVLDFQVVLSRAGATLITLVDSDGFENNEDGTLLDSMAGLATYMADEDIPRVAVAVGRAVGAAYTLLASKGMGFDYSLAFPDAVIAPVRPEAAVHLEYQDELKEKGNTPEVRKAIEKAYAEDYGNAFDAAKKGYVDEVIDPSTLRPYVANALLVLGADE